MSIRIYKCTCMYIHYILCTSHVHVYHAQCIYLYVHTQCQAQVIQEAADALGESPPPLFDPLGEGVDVRELEASIQASGGGGPGTGKSSVGGKVRIHVQWNF